jgi:hypothetical protein
MIPRHLRRACRELSEARVTVAVMNIRWCGDCKDERVFEVPPCEDGHGADCLDLACVDCGSAIVTGIHDDAVPVELAAA